MEVAQEIGATLPVGFGAALNVVYFPQLGYLITLPKYCRTSENGNQSAHSSITATSENTYDSLFGFNLQVSYTVLWIGELNWWIFCNSLQQQITYTIKTQEQEVRKSIFHKNKFTVIYFHPMLELDETIGDIYTIIIDKEIEIIQGLSERVLEYKKQFTDIADILSNIDWYILNIANKD